MARQIFVLSLLLIALVGLVSTVDAADSTPIGPIIPSSVPDDNIIGNTDDAGAPPPNAAVVDAVAAPLGSEIDAKKISPAPSDASTIGVSTMQSTTAAGAVAIAGYFIF
ncbi:hypothetical protein V6N13_018867 [Hibiscus sabdariffa]|uniref:Anther-specific protein BCP1 n=1 Tax=Hibiscus sabdariffa TaxID=183260 RepID=A0ABR2EMC6_9ROSI